MEPIFILPYSEYAIIEEFQKRFSKAKGYAIFIPTSRQQKGVDFLVLKGKKAVTFQVKSSKTYIHGSRVGFTHHLWLNNFIQRYGRGYADWYVIFGLYPTINTKSTKNLKNTKSWKSIILCFRDKEICRMADKHERFMSIRFNLDERGRIKKVGGTRGFTKEKDLSKYLITRRKLI